jgi:hypothetical protein
VKHDAGGSDDAPERRLLQRRQVTGDPLFDGQAVVSAGAQIFPRLFQGTAYLRHP